MRTPQEEGLAATRDGFGSVKADNTALRLHQSVTRDVITVFRDPFNPLGKRFTRDDATGSVTKKSAVTVSLGIAVQHYVPDVQTMCEVLKEVSDDRHAAIINASYPMIDIGKQFLILSEARFAERGVERHDTSQTWPVELDFSGKTYPALGRFKEHSAPTSWLLLDRDIDADTPERFAKMKYGEWLATVDQLIPGILACARLHVLSSSARVFDGSKPLGNGNGHTWLKVSDPSDIERLRQTIPARALELGLAWRKPKRSRDTGEIVGYGLATIIDYSVFNAGRLVFCGCPEVDQ